MKKQTQQQNTYNVPQQQWDSFGPQGQEFFNQLYETCRDKKSQFTQGLNLNESTGSNQIDQLIDKVILYVAQEATLQSQLEHEEG